MNLPSIIIALVIGVIFFAIVGKGIHNMKTGKGGCSCGGNCGACGACGCGTDKKADMSH